MEFYGAPSVALSNCVMIGPYFVSVCAFACTCISHEAIKNYTTKAGEEKGYYNAGFKLFKISADVF